MKDIISDIFEVTTHPKNLRTAIGLSLIGIALSIIIKKRR